MKPDNKPNRRQWLRSTGLGALGGGLVTASGGAQPPEGGKEVQEPTQPRFTRAEYWILEQVVEQGWPLGYLDAENLEELANKPGHGLGRAALLDTLDGLFTAGLIEAGASWGDDAPCRKLSRAELEAALSESGPQPFCEEPYTGYRLTAKGGFQWEAFARPNWNLYLDLDLGYQTGKGSVICTDRQRLEDFFELLAAWDPLVHEGSVRYEEIGPWQATYWKSLPRGWCVHFDYKEPGRPDGDMGSLGRPVYDLEIYDMLDGWYRWR
jgi:hypothetical protein